MRLALRLRDLLFGLLIASMSVAAAEPEAQWKSPDRLVDAFVELALKSEYSRRDTPVRKWMVPIRYHIEHRVGEADLHERLIRTHLGHLTQITGLGITAAGTSADANYLIVLTSDERVAGDTLAVAGVDREGRRERFFRDSLCLASLRAGKSGAIVRAVAVIPVDRARGKGELVACIAEELTHMMGLSNDTDRPLPSIFNHGTVRGHLTGLDTLVLKMLYDPRVKPGMKELKLRPILQRIAAEFEQSRLIEHAEQAAAEGGLAGASP